MEERVDYFEVDPEQLELNQKRSEVFQHFDIRGVDYLQAIQPDHNVRNNIYANH